MPSRLVSRAGVHERAEAAAPEVRITEDAVSELVDAIEAYADRAIQHALAARQQHIDARRLQGINRLEPELRGRHVVAGLAGGLDRGPPGTR